MRGLAVLLSSVILCGCGTSWVAQTSAAREQPRITSLDVADIPANTLALPNASGSIKFAVIGDSGRGSQEQYDVAARMAEYRQRFDYRFVLMAGDNIYEGPAKAEDYRLKFEDPYRALLDGGVTFFAALGNHDDVNEMYYKPFNMDGRRYYTFVPPGDPLSRLSRRARFFAIDSTYVDRTQLAWLDKEATSSQAQWKIAFLHHPLYTSGRYGLVARGMRLALESSLVNGGVDVVFSGHEHLYERIEMQKGILYFISGGAGSLRQGDAAPAPFVSRAYDRDYHFMLAEITDDGFFFQAINRVGETIDAGSLLPVTADMAGRQ